MGSTRFWMAMFLVCAGLNLASQPINAQIDIRSEGGLWIPFLPDYRAASTVNTGFGTVVDRDIFRDEQTSLGMSLSIDGKINLPQNRDWLLDFNFHFAGADVFGSSQSIPDPGATQSIWLAALDGSGFISSANGETVDFSLDSDAVLYGEYVGFRRQLNFNPFGFNYFDLGCGFSHMRLEQEHLFRANFTSTGFSGTYNEQLDSNYLGGEIRTTAIKNVEFGRLIFDFGFGFFWLHGDYDGTSQLMTPSFFIFDEAVVNEQIDAFAVALDFAVKTEVTVGNQVVRPGLQFRYISDIATIEHPHTEVPIEPDPVSLSTQPGYTLGAILEIDLY